MSYVTVKVEVQVVYIYNVVSQMHTTDMHWIH